jgi:hypothetical protein
MSHNKDKYKHHEEFRRLQYQNQFTSSKLILDFEIVFCESRLITYYYYKVLYRCY